MSRDNAPIKNTCPIIDSVISKMESAKNEAEYILKYPEESGAQEASTILGELFDAIREMELIREANTELRSWGNEEYDRAEDLESERDSLLREIEDLKEEIQELKSELEEIGA